MPQESEKITNLVQALIKAQANFVPVEKNKIAKVTTKAGVTYTYHYADLADVLSMAIKYLSAQDIVLLQPNILVGGHLRVCTRLLHATGEWMMSDGILLSEAGDPQDLGRQATYFRRYDACSFLGIAPDEDTDVKNMPTSEPRPVRLPERKAAKAAPSPAAEREEIQARIVALELGVEAIQAKARELFPGRKRMGDLSTEELETLYRALAVRNSDSAKEKPLSPKLQAMIDAGIIERAGNLTSA